MAFMQNEAVLEANHFSHEMIILGQVTSLMEGRRLKEFPTTF